MADHKIEIEVGLNTEGLGKDFDELEKKAKSGTKSVVKAVDQMSSAMAKTGSGAQSAGKEYSQAADSMEKAANGAAASTEALSASVGELENSSRSAAGGQEELAGKTEEARQNVEKSRESFLNWGNIAQTAVKGVVVISGALAAGMAAGAGAAVSFGTEYQKASNVIQTSTGVTKAEMEGLNSVMASVYADNFGEDMNDVAEAVANVKKNLGGTDQEIQEATEAAFGFRDTFGYEIPESTRAASAIMKNFGGTAKEAYDLMAKGAQNGLDFSGELIDNINEYSVQFAKAGLSAEDMFNIMAAGYEEGAWNLDKIGDAVKELNIRLVDGSDTTVAGLEAIGLNADEVAKKMSNGGETAKQTYAEVITKLAEMDDKQAQNIAGVNLFGTMWEDLGPEVIAQLAAMEGEYSNVKGTMDEINQVRYDDAESALEALKRKAEVSLLLPISEDILPAISEATEAAIGYIDQMAEAYETNGVKGLVEESGKVFSQIAVSAAEAAPDMVEAAGEFVEQMVEGLKDNEGRLTKAGGDLVKSAARAVVKLLPKELRDPVEDAVEDIVDSITGGGIKKGLTTFGRMFENGFKVVTTVTKTVLPPFVKIVDETAEHLDLLVPVVTGVYTAFKGYQAIERFASTSKVAGGAVQVLTGQITLSTAATKAWNTVLNLNPVALVVSGVVALGAALVAYKLATEETDASQEAFNRRMDELNQNIENTQEGLDAAAESMKTTFASAEASAAPLERLKGKLDEAFDSTGKVKEGAEDLAQSILNQLNQAMGTEYSLTADGFIQNNEGAKQSLDDITESIDAYVLQLKKKAIAEAAESQYVDLLQKQQEAQENLTKAQKEYNDALDAYAKVQEDWKNGIHDMKALEEAQKNLDKTREALMETTGATEEASTEIEGLDEVIDLLGEGTEESIGKAIDAYAKLPTEAEKARGKVTVSLDQIQKALDSTDPTKMVEGFQLAFNQIEVSGGKIPESLQNALVSAIGKFSELSPEARESAIVMMQMMMDGMSDKIPEFDGVMSMTSDEVLTALQDYLINSGAMKEVGMDTSQEYATGIRNNTQKAVDAAAEVTTNTKSTMKKADATPEGRELGGEFAAGVKSQSSVSGSAGRTIADAANQAAAAVSGKSAGEGYGDTYASGVAGKTGESYSSGSSLAESADSGARTVSGYGAGSEFASGFARGISANSGAAGTAAASLASSALARARQELDSHSPSKKAEKIGNDYGQGYINGIVKLKDKVSKAASQMAQNALDTLKKRSFTMEYDFDVSAAIKKADDVVANRIFSYAELQKREIDKRPQEETKKTEIHQEINFYQPVKTAVETSRVLRREGRRLAYQ